MQTPAHLQNRVYQYDVEPELEPERPQSANQPHTTSTRENELNQVQISYKSRPNPAQPPCQPAPSGEATLLDPRLIDRTLPAAKAIAAALGWVNSVATTVLTARDVQTFITDRPATTISILAGFAFAALLTFGQIYTSGRYRKTYAVFLFPDALMTSLQWGKWLLLPLFIKLIPIWWIAIVVASIVGGIIGIISARIPERLTFGVR